MRAQRAHDSVAREAPHEVAGRHDLTALTDLLGPLAEPILTQLTEVEEGLQAMDFATSGPAVQAARHLLTGGGKRLRPLVCLLAARVIPNARFRTSLPGLAQVAEMIHSASLLHDDVIDLGQMRRSRPAARVVYGNAASVLGGDLLLVEALTLVRATAVPGLVDALLVTLGRVVRAEALQLRRRGRLDVTEDEYFEIVSGKTAALFEWAAEAGARAANASEEQVQALKSFGHELGMAFQLIDDVLDLAQDPLQLGKNTLQDLRVGTLTYPMIHAVRHRPESIAMLGGGDQDPEMIGRTIIDTVEVTGGLVAARREIDRRTGEAVGSLALLPATPARAVLSEMVRQLADRNR